MDWVKTVPLSDLAEKPVLFKRAPKQIALFKVDGTVYAVDTAVRTRAIRWRRAASMETAC